MGPDCISSRSLLTFLLYFARPLASVTILTVSKNAFKGYTLVKVTYNYML